MKKKLLPRRCLLFYFIISITTAVLQAQTPSGLWTDPHIAPLQPGGDGTVSNPYQIARAEHLVWLVERVNSGIDNFAGKNFTLTEDIDLGEHFWVPIGIPNYTFKGHINGNGYSISNLYIEGDRLGDEFNDIGLFGVVETDFAIEHLTLHNPVIKGKNRADATNNTTSTAALIGKITGGDIALTGCHVMNPDITGGINRHPAGISYTGGLIGSMVENGPFNLNILVTSCSVKGGRIQGGAATQSSVTGGLAGFVNNNNFVLTGCMNGSKVSGAPCSIAYTGGLTGQQKNNILQINTCYNTGEIAGGSGHTENYAGGIAGHVHAAGAFFYLYNTGSIELADTDAESYAGGLFGKLYAAGNDDLTVGQSYSACLIRGATATAGGIVGYMQNVNNPYRLAVNDCVAVLEATETTGSTGRIAGRVENGTFTNNHARFLGAPNAGLTAGKDGTPWLLPTTVSLAGVTASWSSGIWDFAGYTYLPKLSAFDPSDQPDVPYSFRGEGTEASPYIIATAEDLQTLAVHVNNLSLSYAGNFFRLAPYGGGDILDLEGEVIEPIGIPDEATQTFRGTFDGGGHTIANLRMHGDELPQRYETGLALFGRLADGGTIRNLTMDHVNITGRDGGQGFIYTAALVGQAAGPITLTNCHIRNITIKSGVRRGTAGAVYLGGLAGGIKTATQCLLTACTISEGSISLGYTPALPGRVGGIAGILEVSEDSYMTDCKVTGVSFIPSGTMQYYEVAAGGLVGRVEVYNQADLFITGVQVADCMITSKQQHNSSYAGGLIGYLNNATLREVSCKNTLIQGGGAGPESCTGGLVGKGDNLKGITAGAAENVTILSGNANQIYTGGLIGFASSPQQIATCFATGEVQTSISANQSSSTGGLIGFCTVENGRQTLICDNYTQMRLMSSGFNDQSSVTGGIIGMINNRSANPENMILRNCYVTGEIQDNWAHPDIVTSGGIAGQNHYSKLQDNLVMLTEFNPSYSHTHRIAGEHTTVTELFSSNYAYIAGRELLQPASPEDKNGGNWSGSFTQAPVSNWDKTIWTVDPDGRLMPMLNCFAAQPQIVSLLYRPKVTIPVTEGVTTHPVPGSYTLLAYSDNFTFTLTLKEGYQEDSQPEVWANQTLLTAEEVTELTYTYTIPNIEENITITINGIHPDTPPGMYNISIHATQGVTIDPAPGSYTLTEGDNFTFTLTLHEGYLGSQPEVWANRFILTPDEVTGRVYTYTLADIKENISVSIHGISPDIPTAVEELSKDRNKVYTIPGHLVTELPQASFIRIYAFNGTQVKHLQASSGSTSIPLPKGIYIIHIGKETYKVIIH